MIRILANLFKSRGEVSPVLTAADFRLDDDASGIGALLDSVSNAHHRTLREKAQQNIISVTGAVPNHATVTPHLQEIIGSLWLRSIAVANNVGADPATLQVDITRDKAIDGNAFEAEIAIIEENGFNIHKDGDRLVFREEENPQAKLMAYARNDKLFVDGSDLTQLAKEVRYVIGGTEEVAKNFRVIALPDTWLSDPWSSLDKAERPEQWDARLPILVLPEEPDKIDERLGQWIKTHLQRRRNTIRFLIPCAGSSSAFQDRGLLIFARAEMKALEWSGQNPEYKKLHTKYQKDLRDILEKRFDRFAVLNRWNFADPDQCIFSVETLKMQGAKIPEGIEQALLNDLFVPEDFEALVLEAAAASTSVGKLLNELQEPRPAGQDCIPWLGETSMKERIVRLCARGKIAIDLRGLEFLQAKPGEDEDTAWSRLRSKLSSTGRLLDEIRLLEPSAVPNTGGTSATLPPTGGADDAGGTGGDLFGGGTTAPLPNTGGATSLGGFTRPPTDGGIFGGGAAGGGSKPRVVLSNPPTSALNLLGKIEGWGIGPATQVAEVMIKVSSASGAQLKELVKKLPDGLTFELSLKKEDD